MATLQLQIPDDLAGEAQAAGLLQTDTLAALLRAEMRRRRVDDFFAAADRLSALSAAPLTEAEVEAEIAAARAARRVADANRR